MADSIRKAGSVEIHVSQLGQSVALQPGDTHSLRYLGLRCMEHVEYVNDLDVAVTLRPVRR